jgi:DNA-binding HxlR family transcriptional regulator
MQRLIDSISAKVLSKELKDLELNGFVPRNVFTGTPVAVKYELTEYAETLGCVIQSPSEWRAKHKEMVNKSMQMKEGFLNLRLVC